MEIRIKRIFDYFPDSSDLELIYKFNFVVSV